MTCGGSYRAPRRREGRAVGLRQVEQGPLERADVMSRGGHPVRHDALCPPERHREIASLVGTAADLVVVEGAGHLPTLERPEATSAVMRRWLFGAAG